jgi:hypothetical protein
VNDLDDGPAPWVRVAAFLAALAVGFAFTLAVLAVLLLGWWEPPGPGPSR